MKTGRLPVLLLCAAAFTCGAQVSLYKKEDLRKRLLNSDTVFVVNFWATWCAPCVKEIPSFDSLQTKHGGDNVKVLLVSLDFVEDLPQRVIPFLQKKQVTSSVLLLDESNPNDYINLFCPQWSGAIPFTLVQKGERREIAEKGLVLADLEKMVEDVRE